MSAITAVAWFLPASRKFFSSFVERIILQGIILERALSFISRPTGRKNPSSAMRAPHNPPINSNTGSWGSSARLLPAAPVASHLMHCILNSSHPFHWSKISSGVIFEYALFLVTVTLGSQPLITLHILICHPVSTPFPI